MTTQLGLMTVGGWGQVQVGQNTTLVELLHNKKTLVEIDCQVHGSRRQHGYNPSKLKPNQSKSSNSIVGRVQTSPNQEVTVI